jgi:hypothetical protein
MLQLTSGIKNGKSFCNKHCLIPSAAQIKSLSYISSPNLQVIPSLEEWIQAIAIYECEVSRYIPFMTQF